MSLKDIVIKYGAVALSLALPVSNSNVDVPSYISITGASLPSSNNPSTNPLDFFFGYLMDSGFNRVDSSVNPGGELESNNRLINDSSQGHSDINYSNGLLGSYSFLIGPNTPYGVPLHFNLNDVFFGTTDFDAYSTPDIGSGGLVNVFNTDFY